MCSWCWGYHNTWEKLQALLNEQFAETLEVQSVLGGLAPDSNEPMPDDLKAMLQKTWGRIHEQLGTEFNFDFWTKCQPKRSTYPACRAVLVAREQGAEKSMYHAVQRAYYLNAQNPSELTTLTALAGQIGLDEQDFENRIQSDAINQQLMDEISLARQLPIQGFPSLVLNVNGQNHAIKLHYSQAEKTLHHIQTILTNQKCLTWLKTTLLKQK
tara:strand:- start:6346 stop:6984 length:639 start_codon:yes stop_codon:yes gene_type:complete